MLRRKLEEISTYVERVVPGVNPPTITKSELIKALWHIKALAEEGLDVEEKAI